MQEATVSPPVDRNVDFDSVIQELYASRADYPKAVIAAVRANREAFIPRLIGAIDHAVEEVCKTGKTGNAAFFALPLLAEFDAREAWPSILAALRLPDDALDELFGALITEGLNGFLARFCESPEKLDEIIDDRSINEYVRNSAMRAFLEFVFDGRLSRTQAVERLQQHLRTAIERKDLEGVNWLVSSLVDYAPHEALADIREAYRQKLVDEFLIGLKYIERSLAEGREEFAKSLDNIACERETNFVDDIASWSCYSEPVAAVRPPHYTPWNAEPLLDDSDEELIEDPFLSAGTIRYVEARVGRNDPCPCGSGKKFKKCCGGR